MASENELPTIREEVIVPGQLVKRVVKEGNPDEECPVKGSDVTVHYTGRLLNGTVFDSSHKRNDPFKFKIGQGQVIKGWDEGVATMRPGEKAYLRCEPDFAYGASGSPPTIPPNSTLEFEVDLISWTNEQVLEDSNGQVTKKLIKEGSGFTNPEDYATVSIKYSAKVLPNGPVFHALSEQEESYLIGENPEAIEGFEAALKSMKQGEKAAFTVLSSWAYGPKGDASLNIPENAKIRYEIELFSFENPKDTYSMTFEERLAYMTKLKELGNKFFKSGKIVKAEAKYADAVRLFDYEKDLTEEQIKQVNVVRVVSLQNQAICQFKQKEYGKSLETCQKALSFDPKHIKCLFKKGQSHFALDQLPEAEKDLSTALSLDTENKEIQRELALVKRKIKAEKDAEKKRFGGFFNKISLVSEDEAKYEPKKEESADMSSDEEEFAADAKPAPIPEEPVANPPASVESGPQEQ